MFDRFILLNSRQNPGNTYCIMDGTGKVIWQRRGRGKRILEKISLLIRVIGSICLVGGMSLGGILTADRFRGRLEELNGISRVFLMLRGEVEYHGLVLPEAIRSVGMRMDGGLKELLMGIAEKMEDGSGLPFGVIWRKALKQYFAYSYLNKEDQKLLLTMGNHLGYQDKRMRDVQH